MKITVDKVLGQLREKGIQIHLGKSAWARDTVEYLGYVISRDSIRPQKKGMLDSAALRN